MRKIPIRKIRPSLRQLSSGHFSIRKVESLLEEGDLFHELHRHDFYFVMVLEKGAGKHEIDFSSYDVVDQSIFCLRPGQVHQLELKSNSVGYILEFDIEFFHPKDQQSAQRLRKVTNKNYCKTEHHRFTKLYSILNDIFNEFTEREQGYADAIRAGLELFCIDFIRQSPNELLIPITAHSYSQERLEEFTELLEKNVITQKQVSFCTQLMNLSAYQLNEITKATIGKTASSLITDHIILEAKRNLLATSNQVKEIADQLGYEDASYFIRFFKKQTGLSPEAFRSTFV